MEEKESIFLSVVIPHYNLPRELLERSVASITTQKNIGSYEVIVVDDGSQAPPRWLESQFTGQPVRMESISHGGPGAARNHGMNTARGRYILFVDADDCLQADSMAPCLEILHNEQPDILRFRYRVCPGGVPSNEQHRTTHIKCGNIISGAMYMADNNLSGSPCTYFFKRETADKHNIRFTTNVYHEDEEFNTKLHYHATTLIDTDAVIYNYCIRRESVTSSSNTEFEKRRIDNLFSLLTHLVKFRADEQQHSNSIQRKALQRKLTMLTVDTLLNLLYDGRTASDITSACDNTLRPLSLYPLPPAAYGTKYQIFRTLANSNAGIRLLRMLVKSKKPQKK